MRISDWSSDVCSSDLILTCAKGLTNGAVPRGAAVANRAIHDAVVADVEAPGIEFCHGYTYSGHPLAAAAAIAALDVYADNALFSRAAELAPAWEEALHCLAEAPGVRDIRTIGLVAGIELEPRKDAPGKRALEIFHRCFRSEEHTSELQSLMRIPDA